jgi:hypothetical protein
MAAFSHPTPLLPRSNISKAITTSCTDKRPLTSNWMMKQATIRPSALSFQSVTKPPRSAAAGDVRSRRIAAEGSLAGRTPATATSPSSDAATATPTTIAGPPASSTAPAIAGPASVAVPSTAPPATLAATSS